MDAVAEVQNYQINMATAIAEKIMVEVIKENLTEKERHFISFRYFGNIYKFPYFSFGEIRGKDYVFGGVAFTPLNGWGGMHVYLSGNKIGNNVTANPNKKVVKEMFGQDALAEACLYDLKITDKFKEEAKKVTGVFCQMVKKFVEGRK